MAPEPVPLVEFIEVTLPDTVWTGQNNEFIIKADLSGVNKIEPDIFGITGIIQQAGFSYSFNLEDNGEFPDVVPGDMRYALTIDSDNVKDITGTAQITLSISTILTKPSTSPLPPWELGEAYTADITIVATKDSVNSPPLIQNFIDIDDVIVLDSTEYTEIFLLVLDPNGIDDIKSTQGLLYYPNQAFPRDTIFINAQVGPVIAIEPPGILAGAVFAGRMMHDKMLEYGEGDYTLLLYAEDKAGNRSNEIVKMFSAVTSNVDYPPEIVSITAPDSFRADGSLIFLAVEAYDQNGMNDISKVYFTTIRPDGTSSGTPFYMYDDGSTILREGVASGDLVESDGIYSLTIQLPSSTTNGQWKFKFFVVDKQLNQVWLEHPIYIY
ncbi:hypothetical protein ACFL67_04270 [candidate division KSB1 bacterium]